VIARQKTFNAVEPIVIYEETLKRVAKVLLHVSDQSEPDLLADTCVELLDLVQRIRLVQLDDSARLNRLLATALSESYLRVQKFDEFLEFSWVYNFRMKVP
jgi:hypothetical protein